MSLLTGRGGLRGRGRREQGLNIDLTPVIDVTFQLLIFFVLTSTFQNNPSFKVKLPKARNLDSSQEPKAVVVMIGTDGRFEMEGKAVDDRELELRVCRAAEGGTNAVNIRADENAPHRFVVQVMDIAKACKIEKLGILHGR